MQPGGQDQQGQLEVFWRSGLWSVCGGRKSLQFDIDKTEFEQVMMSRIVNHIQKDDRIRVRYLSVTSPHDEAIQVELNLKMLIFTC